MWHPRFLPQKWHRTGRFVPAVVVLRQLEREPRIVSSISNIMKAVYDKAQNTITNLK